MRISLVLFCLSRPIRRQVRLFSKDHVKEILFSAIEAVDPVKAVHKFVQKEESTLVIDGVKYESFDQLRLVAFGKASASMASAR